MKKLYFHIFRFIYSIVRPLVLSNYDPNEDYFCCNCGKPVLKRFLFCNQKCENDAVT